MRKKTIEDDQDAIDNQKIVVTVDENCGRFICTCRICSSRIVAANCAVEVECCTSPNPALMRIVVKRNLHE